MATVESRAAAAVDLSDPGLYVNRELSWLDFNARVLALAADASVPLLERCKFLAIFSSNLDEFFMVRVAAVQEALESGRLPSTPDQMPRAEVLDRIATRVRELTAEQTRLWTDEVRPALADAGLRIATLDELDEPSRRALDQGFDREVYPVLTPLAVGPGLPFPYISALSLNLGLRVRDPVDGESRFARVKVPPRMPRFLEAGDALVAIEHVIKRHLDRLFPGMEITQSTLFRVTRDADFSISDEADDLLGAVEAQLRRRRFGHVVRLEVEADAPPDLVEELTQALGVTERDVFRVRPPLDFTALWQLATLDRPALRDPSFEPRTQPRLRAEGRDPVDLFAAMRAGDVLVHHPYDDFRTSVERFVEQAVEDPNVLAIKQTMYRTSGDSPIVPALMRAADQGKQTVCLVEVQARFDEERNIQWARALERAGVHVVYGQSGLKTHAKLALVVRREGNRLRRYVHVGTGNYNPSTARLYTDLGLFTTDEDLASDVADLFNHLTGFARAPVYRKILVAPRHLRNGLLAEIERVTAAHAGGGARPRRDEGERDRRRPDHRGALPGLTGRRPGRPDRPRHLRPARRRAGRLREHPGRLDRRAVPGARADLRLHQRGGDALLHRLGGPDGPQPRPPGRGGGAGRGPGPEARGAARDRPPAGRHVAGLAPRSGRLVGAARRRPGCRPDAEQPGRAARARPARADLRLSAAGRAGTPPLCGIVTA